MKLCGFVLIVGCVTACGRTSEPPASFAPPNASAPPGAAVASPSRTAAVPVGSGTAGAEQPVASAVQLIAEPIALPGATGPVSLDFLFYEPQRARVWVPAGGTGSVDVFEIAKHGFNRIEGFKTVAREARGKTRLVGPSSGTIGEGFAYIGNRATQEVCAVDLQTLELGPCFQLPAAPDGVEYVPSLHQVWVTTPSIQSIVVLEALPKGYLKKAGVIKLGGEPECYALDEPHGLFFTNLEDKGTTLSIDLKTRLVKDTWSPGCSAQGPRGVAVDSARRLVLVACTDHVQVLDAARGGALLGTLETGAGLDNIDYVPSTGLVYAAAGKAARLTIARVGDHGELTLVASGVTAPGARNAVADGNGNAYVADAQGAHLLVFRAPRATDSGPVDPPPR